MTLRPPATVDTTGRTIRHMPTAYTDGLSSGVHALLWVTGLATPTIGLLVLYALFTPTIRTARTRWTSYQLTRRARRSGRTTQA